MRLSLAISTAFAGSVLTAASCGGGESVPGSPAAAPPAKAVQATVGANGLHEDRDLAYAKPKGRMRIVCVGGSVTFGDGVARDATYVAWMQTNMRGRGYDVEVLNAGKPGRSLADSAMLLDSELLKYEPDLVVLSLQKDDGSATAELLSKIETQLSVRKIVYILLAVPDFPAVAGYTPKRPSVYVVPSKAALDVFADENALLDASGRWTEFAHMKMGNALAELIVGAPLLCCATAPVPEHP